MDTGSQAFQRERTPPAAAPAVDGPRASWPTRAVLAATVCTLAATGCRSSDSGGRSAGAAPPSGGSAPARWLSDVTDRVGLDFAYEPGATGELALPEIMGGGAALFDHDGDGDLDVYLTNGRHGPGRAASAGAVRNRLYRQEPGGRFVDATETSGLGDEGYGMGVAVGDVDNDGDADVYVTNVGADRLFRNRGDGTFEDATSAAGIRVGGWSTSAVFFDYDRDGFLDLYVARYVRHDPAKRCVDAAGRPDYCTPELFPAEHDVLLHNSGDGTFEDVSERSGVSASIGPGLGVVAEDFDGDGWSDLYVANDGTANLYWLNQRDGTFRDEAVLMGVAYNLDGRAEAGMGVLAADLDNDLDVDLFLTHLANETNTFYRNRGGSRGFVDSSGAAALASASLSYTGFGTAALDLELDGDLDLLIANGRVTRATPRPGGFLVSPWDRFAEPNLAFINEGEARFRTAGEELEAFSSPLEISRGMATGDVDGDGDVDVLLSNVQSRARLYYNEAPRAGSWLSVRAIDPRYRRDAIGATVVVVAGESRQRRTIGGGYGYLSSSDPRAYFGLGRVAVPLRLEVRWPDGLTEAFSAAQVNRAITVIRGSGETS